MIEDILKKLDFNDKEVVVYLLVLQHGKLTPVEISKLTKINRTTVYSTAKELVKKGILLEDVGNTKSTFVALPPSSFEHLLKKEQKKLEDKKILTMQAIRELGALAVNMKYSVPKIVFVQEEDVEAHLYRQAPIWNRSMLDSNTKYWGFQDSSFVDSYEKWIDWYWTEEPSSRNVELKLLSTEQAEQLKKQKYSRRQIEFWDKAKDITATTWVMGDYVTMIVTNQKPHYLVEVMDKTLAHNLRVMFRGLWEEVIENKKMASKPFAGPT